jgi:predicted nucleic acid-binding protein
MICFDTQVVIWSVQRKARPGQEALVLRAAKYIRYLEEQGERVMVPAPVAGEYLIGFNGQDRAAQQSLIQRLFYVPAFDMPAAVMQAEIESDKKLLLEMKKEFNLDRQQLRTDAQILAVAIVNKADKIISHDPHMSKLAGTRIKVEQMPEIAEQMPLLSV